MSAIVAQAHHRPDGPTADTAPIRRLTRRVAGRIGVQRGLQRALWVGGLGLAVAALVLVLVQSLWLSPALVTPALILCGIGTLAAFASGFWGRPQAIALAARIDVANDLHSDLSNALALGPGAGGSEMAHLAIARGLGAAKTADWRLAVPWRGAIPTSAWIVAGAGAVVFFLAALWAPALGSDNAARAVAALPDVGRPERPEALALNAATVEALEDLRPAPAPADEDEAETQALDERVKGAVDALDALVQAVLDGQLSQEEAFSQLSQLEGDLSKWQNEVGGGFAEAQERVADAAKARLEDKRQASQALHDMLEALRKRSWSEAAAAAEAAATKLADGSLDKREQEKLTKSLEKLATDLKSEHAKKEKALREEEDRLKSKEKLAPEKMTPKEKERLKELERELESLEREEKEVSEAMRELAKLAREFEDLARELMKRFKLKGAGGSGDSGDGGGQGENKKSSEGGKGESGEGGKGEQGAGGAEGPEDSLKRAAEIIRKLGAGEASSAEAEKALDRIERMRDALKDGGKEGQEVGGGAPPGEKPEGGQEGAAGAQGAAGASGEEGQPNGGREGQDGTSMAMGESSEQGGAGGEMPGQKGQEAGAGQGQGGPKGQGQNGQPGAMSLGEGDPSGKEPKMSMQGKGDGGKEGGEASQMGGPGDSKGASLGNGKAPGQGGPKVGTSGVGSGHDTNLLGEKTGADGKAKAEFVPGQQGEGQSTSNIVEVAAQRGFATAGYEEVLQDYRDVAEDALKRELIPAGKRGYVRRYFDLIKPR